MTLKVERNPGFASLSVWMGCGVGAGLATMVKSAAGVGGVGVCSGSEGTVGVRDAVELAELHALAIRSESRLRMRGISRSEMVFKSLYLDPYVVY